jgi:hypothetical protein
MNLPAQATCNYGWDILCLCSKRRLQLKEYRVDGRAAALQNVLVVQRFFPKPQDHLRSFNVAAANPHQALRCVAVQLWESGNVDLRLGGRAHGEGARGLITPIQAGGSLRAVMNDQDRAASSLCEGIQEQ